MIVSYIFALKSYLLLWNLFFPNFFFSFFFFSYLLYYNYPLSSKDSTNIAPRKEIRDPDGFTNLYYLISGLEVETIYSEDKTFEIDLHHTYYIKQIKIRMHYGKHSVVSIEADGVVYIERETNSNNDAHYNYDCNWRAQRINISIRKGKGGDYRISDIRVIVPLMVKNRK